MRSDAANTVYRRRIREDGAAAKDERAEVLAEEELRRLGERAREVHDDAQDGEVRHTVDAGVYEPSFAAGRHGAPCARRRCLYRVSWVLPSPQN